MSFRHFTPAYLCCIMFSEAPAGTISPAGFTNAAKGSDVVLTITPAEGYVVDKLLVNGSDVTASIVTGTYTISSISENKVVTVTFKES